MKPEWGVLRRQGERSGPRAFIPSVSPCLVAFLLPTAQLLLGTQAWLPPSTAGTKTLSSISRLLYFSVSCRSAPELGSRRADLPAQCSGCTVKGFWTMKNPPGSEDESSCLFSTLSLALPSLSLPLVSTPGIPLNKIRHCNPPCLPWLDRPPCFSPPLGPWGSTLPRTHGSQPLPAAPACPFWVPQEAPWPTMPISAACIAVCTQAHRSRDPGVMAFPAFWQAMGSG